MPATEIEAYGDDTRLHFDGESDFPRFLDSVLQRTDQISQTKVACSRLRDGGGKSFSKKKCEKRAGAGERQGGGACTHFFNGLGSVSRTSR